MAGIHSPGRFKIGTAIILPRPCRRRTTGKGSWLLRSVRKKRERPRSGRRNSCAGCVQSPCLLSGEALHSMFPCLSARLQTANGGYERSPSRFTDESRYHRRIGRKIHSTKTIPVDLRRNILYIFDIPFPLFLRLFHRSSIPRGRTPVTEAYGAPL